MLIGLAAINLPLVKQRNYSPVYKFVMILNIILFTENYNEFYTFSIYSYCTLCGSLSTNTVNKLYLLLN